MSLCLARAALSVVMATSEFTLAWTHSIEKTRWEEDWRVTPAGLELVEARIRGSGAGMDPPEGARWEAGAWHFRPALPALPAFTLAASEFTADHELCIRQRCRALADWLPAPGPVRFTPCRLPPTP
ncbi:DUF1850 domain-containing protein [Piscinibacter sp.]|uniref:DUF1850 domain-containing protein n=1 Tax=Piscinibacter sp. TaxID=1903157 RepID=UPI002B9772EC|nr:DUF1850 domain-containing protein [Albitalea sp.]HUG22026.1 DUF1850 domain-containing protein [Albitalea sp.]